MNAIPFHAYRAEVGRTIIWAMKIARTKLLSSLCAGLAMLTAWPVDAAATTPADTTPVDTTPVDTTRWGSTTGVALVGATAGGGVAIDGRLVALAFSWDSAFPGKHSMSPT
jgi:hypothetical protein